MRNIARFVDIFVEWCIKISALYQYLATLPVTMRRADDGGEHGSTTFRRDRTWSGDCRALRRRTWWGVSRPLRRRSESHDAGTGRPECHECRRTEWDNPGRNNRRNVPL